MSPLRTSPVSLRTSTSPLRTLPDPPPGHLSAAPPPPLPVPPLSPCACAGRLRWGGCRKRPATGSGEGHKGRRGAGRAAWGRWRTTRRLSTGWSSRWAPGGRAAGSRLWDVPGFVSPRGESRWRGGFGVPAARSAGVSGVSVGQESGAGSENWCFWGKKCGCGARR